jgi:rhamnosyl/mannosyltransferase
VRPRVLQVTKFYPSEVPSPDDLHLGGLEAAVRDLAEGLRDRADIEVLASRARGFGRREVVGGVSVRRTWSAGVLAAQPLAPSLPWRMRARGYDIVHVHLPNPLAALGRPAPGGVLVVHYHSDIVRQQRLRRVVDPLVDRLLRRADRIIVSSPPLLERSEVLRAHGDRCRVVPFGIDLDAIRPASPGDAAALRRRLDLAPGDRVLLFVGRLVYYKGVDVLLEAMRHVDARLVVVGEGPLRAELQARAPADKVRFAGRVPAAEIEPYYAMADAFVLPAVAPSEAFGIVQIEAMARGLPVVNTSVPSGVPWVSRHDRSGLTVAPCDVDALAGALQMLVADEDLRARLSRGALDRASELSMRAFLEGVWTIYEEALGAHRYPVDP